MQNAHLRMGQLEYRRSTGKTDTKISVHVDRYVGEGEDAHLISLFGGTPRQAQSRQRSMRSTRSL
jgi:hypothetical protein